TASRSPKFIGAKLGLASALALGSLPMTGTEASATPAVPSDTLQVGAEVPGSPNTIPAQLFEGSEPGSISQSVTVSVTGGVVLTSGTKPIVLLAPGTTSASDIVTATLTCLLGETGPGGTCNQFRLDVTLTSDGETPLTAPSG